MIGAGWPFLMGVIGIIHTIADAQKQKKRYEKEMVDYKAYLREFEKTRDKYIELVNAGKYYVKEEVVTSKDVRSDFHDLPHKYYINNHFQVSQGTYVTTDYGDIIRMYGVEGFGVHLMILQKRKDLSEYEIKTVRY